MVLITDGERSYGFKCSQVQNIWQDEDFAKIWLQDVNGDIIILMITTPTIEAAAEMIKSILNENSPSIYRVDELGIIS